MIFNTFGFILAAAGDAGAGNVPNQTGEMIKMVAMVDVFGFMMYFLMIRPQSKRAKEHEAMMKTLKAGDKVVTTSGIIGVVIAVKDRSVSLRSADTKLEVLKSAVAEVTERGGETSQS
jgi:preprotein translocase subunit YajC